MADPRKDEEATTIKVASSKKESTAKERQQANGIIKLKKPAPKHNKPGNWKDGSVIDDEKKAKAAAASAITAASPGPVVNPLDESARETFATGRPLEDSPELQQCKHCKKSILKTAAREHIAACLKLKKEKAQRKKEAREARERARELALKEEEQLRKAAAADEEAEAAARTANANANAAAAQAAQTAQAAAEDSSDGDEDAEAEKKDINNPGGKTTKKAAGKKTDTPVTGKKRKAETEPEKIPKAKKKKDEPKPKAAKPKGPVDVERQCGVILPNGQPCARSLTCKSHSMGSKRAVPGRSLPYDMLLAAYQKKNQAKQQKAAIDANAPLEDDDDPHAGAVDSDEETAAVMGALAHWNPTPAIPQPVFTPIKRQYQLARLHEQLQTATNGGRVNIFKVVGYGAQRLPDGHPGLYEPSLIPEDSPADPADPTAVMGGGTGPFSRRSSSYSISGVSQRRPSVSSRA